MDCHTVGFRKAGFLCKNEEAGGLVLERRWDADSAYNPVIEYGGNGARVRNITSTGATTQALKMVGNGAEIGIAVPAFADTERPVPLGITELLEFVDAPAHIADLKRYRARGYRIAGNRIAVVTDHPEDLVEVHPPSRGSVDLGGLTIEQCPPVPAMG